MSPLEDYPSRRVRMCSDIYLDCPAGVEYSPLPYTFYREFTVLEATSSTKATVDGVSATSTATRERTGTRARATKDLTWKD